MYVVQVRGRCREGCHGVEQPLVQRSAYPRRAVSSDRLPGSLLQTIRDGVSVGKSQFHGNSTISSYRHAAQVMVDGWEFVLLGLKVDSPLYLGSVK